MATMAETKRVENIILKATTIAFASPKNLTRREHGRSREVRDDGSFAAPPQTNFRLRPN
jgi:hypothetical protein